jgi:hypothetical protein
MEGLEMGGDIKKYGTNRALEKIQYF